MKYKLVLAVGALSIIGAIAVYANGFRCPQCNGTGWSGPVRCLHCKGSGAVNY